MEQCVLSLDLKTPEERTPHAMSGSGSWPSLMTMKCDMPCAMLSREDRTCCVWTTQSTRKSAADVRVIRGLEKSDTEAQYLGHRSAHNDCFGCFRSQGERKALKNCTDMDADPSCMVQNINNIYTKNHRNIMWPQSMWIGPSTLIICGEYAAKRSRIREKRHSVEQRWSRSGTSLALSKTIKYVIETILLRVFSDTYTYFALATSIAIACAKL